MRHPIALVAVALVIADCGSADRVTPPLEHILERAERLSLTDADVAPLAEFVALTASGRSPGEDELPHALRSGHATVLVTLRREGRYLHSVWQGGASAAAAIRAGLAAAREKLGDGLDGADTVTLDLARSFEMLELPPPPGALADELGGIRGLELLAAGGTFRAVTTEMIAQNRTPDDLFTHFLRAAGMARGRLAGSGAVARVFDADQVLVRVGASPSAVRMIRGNRIVEPEEVTSDAVRSLAEDLAGWLVRNLREDGGIVEALSPGRGETIDAGEPTRQWLAVFALERLAATRGDPELLARAERSLRSNLLRFFRFEADRGVIESKGEVTLGGLALAGLALAAHPEPRGELQSYEVALRRTIDALSGSDGSFRTFYRPADRDENQNVYPGQALVLWAADYERSRDPALLERIRRSLRYYALWHLGHRHPAFVPWHTRAASMVWRSTRDPELAEVVYSLNDWLLSIQQWESAPFPDLRGRFFDPARPDYAEPGAFSPGAAVASLLDAERLASANGDSARAARYAEGVRRGLRSCLQRVFHDDVDLFYVSDRERVRGGIRTSVTDDVILTADVAETLLAALEVLETDVVQAPPAR